MDSVTDKLNTIFKKHKDDMEGGFHNMLWQIMVNESCEGAFIVQYDGMIVVAQECGGYVPCHVKVKNGAAHEAGHDNAEGIVDDLNAEVFGLLPEGAFRIVAKSMRKKA